MVETKGELYKYQPIVDGYGGSTLVPVPQRVLVGKFIPKTSTKTTNNNKINFEMKAKFISNQKVEPQEGQLFKHKDTMYSIVSVKETPTSRCVLELVCNG